MRKTHQGIGLVVVCVPSLLALGQGDSVSDFGPQIYLRIGTSARFL